MLVISRLVNESLVINDNIIVTILGIEGDKVKIGVSAPREVVILREELWQAFHEQERLAARLADQEASPGFEELRMLLIDEAQSTDETTQADKLKE
jgi:carbon storage regulator